MAPDLLGKILRVGELAVRIDETEAYLESDAASHSFHGMTKRNAVMFGEPGYCYVYFVYGMHWCCNVVTGLKGDGQAVLIRGGTPVAGVETMRANRQRRKRDADLANGPGKLTKALGIQQQHNGRDLCHDPTFCLTDDGCTVSVIVSTPRIGITRNADKMWRFTAEHHPAT